MGIVWSIFDHFMPKSEKREALEIKDEPKEEPQETEYDLRTAMQVEGVLYDSHCHIDFIWRRLTPTPTSFSEFRQAFQNEFPKSFHGFVAVFCQPDKWARFGVEEQVESTPNGYAIYGCHPHFATDFDQYSKKLLVSLLDRPNVVGLGEIGLDYSSKNNTSKVVQQRVFALQLEMALERDLPVCLHIRDATQDGFMVMEKVGVPRDHPIHLHCFTGDWNECQIWLDKYPNLKVGLTNVITYGNAPMVKNVARYIPLERLVLETDSPYFIPRKGLDPNSTLTTTSHPGHVIHVAAQIAHIRGIDVSQVIRQTAINTEEVYRMKNSIEVFEIVEETKSGQLEIDRANIDIDRNIDRYLEMEVDGWNLDKRQTASNIGPANKKLKLADNSVKVWKAKKMVDYSSSDSD